MFISHVGDQRSATNVDNISRIILNGKYITAYMVDGSNHHIAKCETPEEADKLYDMIITRIGRGI